ncbi:MAG: nucleotidyltransferase domain-containing protein [Candidatus Aenigmarchaeota archaeon]|nr:nucleotidyltransferase domain-containing protein [Candidatus Aenigmarchaeota archaeon]
MISQIFDSGSFKVLALFALSPGSRFRRKEIKERIKLHNVPLDKSLSKLASSGMIKKEGAYYSINFGNSQTENVITIVAQQHKQLKNIPLDVHLLLADIAAEIAAIKGLEIWLFGSYSKLVYSEKSDVDVAVLGPESIDKQRIRRLFKRLERHYGKEIGEHFFELHAFYRNKKDPLVKEILQHGIRLL